MKIEMCESLVASWLKHVKGCTVVQTNWKPSPNWEEHNLDDIERLVQEGKQFFGQLDIFKKNADATQILHQTECDVVGLSAADGSWHAVESAFHSNGVQYGKNKHESAAKIAGKLFRAAIGLHCYMDVRKGSICFAAPKVTHSYEEVLRPAFDMVVGFFRQQGFEFDFRLLINGDFQREIMEPMLPLVAEVSDTAELFLRAVQLEVVSGMPQKGGNRSGESGNANGNGESDVKATKIGNLVNTVVRAILEGLENDSEVEDLMSAEYSKEAFGLKFPLLVKDGEPFDKRRYYAEPLVICGVSYHLCNDWYARNRAALEAWIAQHEADQEDSAF